MPRMCSNESTCFPVSFFFSHRVLRSLGRGLRLIRLFKGRRTGLNIDMAHVFVGDYESLPGDKKRSTQHRQLLIGGDNVKRGLFVWKPLLLPSTMKMSRIQNPRRSICERISRRDNKLRVMFCHSALKECKWKSSYGYWTNVIIKR